ncbi:hypothetical protein ACMXYO_08275 [Neptuniibacter sp. QD37_6]|uniref:hypothetical protein n=1 Tax=Neptuniibacter sp. QD37_6 TaxID=3398210 RepID=UPI0039F582BA
MTLADSKKLTVIFRIEPGCLGPEGLSHVDKFCIQAGLKLQRSAPAYITWQVEPRHDKTLPEIDYAILGRALSRDHAKRYLSHFDQQIDSFEMEAFDELPDIIDQYFGR